MIRSLCIVFLLIFCSSTASAEKFRLGILHGDPEVFAYEISVIQLALDNADGEHSLELIYLPKTPQKRVLNMLEHGHLINIFFTGYSKEREKRFLQIDIPLTRGLLGHRVFIKRKTPSLKEVRTLQDLRQFPIGSGIGWPDTEIFRENGFKVVEASYQSLWKMLDKNRFALFNRGINEASIELLQQREEGYDFEIDPYVLVSYPFDYFIYLNKASRHLFSIIQQGLERAYENGSFMKNFRNTPSISKAIHDTDPANRLHFRLENPMVSERIHAIPTKFWHQF